MCVLVLITSPFLTHSWTHLSLSLSDQVHRMNEKEVMLRCNIMHLSFSVPGALFAFGMAFVTGHRDEICSMKPKFSVLLLWITQCNCEKWMAVNIMVTFIWDVTPCHLIGTNPTFILKMKASAPSDAWYLSCRIHSIASSFRVSCSWCGWTSSVSTAVIYLFNTIPCMP